MTKYIRQESNMLINKETGEVIQEYRNVSDFSYGNHYYNDDLGYKFRARTKSAVRTFSDIPIPEGLDDIDLGRLYRLSRFMWHSSGVLAEVRSRVPVPFSRGRLYKALGFKSRTSGARFVNRMINLSMIRSATITLPNGKQKEEWFMNPLYFSVTWLNRTLYMIWQDQIDEFLPSYVKQELSCDKCEQQGDTP